MPISRQFRTGPHAQGTAMKTPPTLSECIEFLFVVKGALFNAVPESMLVNMQNGMIEVIDVLKSLTAKKPVLTLTEEQYDGLKEVDEFYNAVDIPVRINAALSLLEMSARSEKALKPEENAGIRSLIQQTSSLLVLAMPVIASIVDDNDHSQED